MEDKKFQSQNQRHQASTLAKTLVAFADKYGPIFTIYLGAYPALVISNAEAAKECFTTSDKILASRPKSSHAVHFSYNYAGFGAAPYGPYWRKIRKLVVISEWLDHLAFNIITSLIAGKRYFGYFQDADDEEACHARKIIKDAMDISGEFVPSDSIPILEWFNFEGQMLKSLKRIGRDLDALVGSWIKEHLMKKQKYETRDEKQDFIDVMLSVIEEDAN